MDTLLKAGYPHVVDTDLQGDFDSIPHDKLMERISDGRLLIRAWLAQNIVKEMERWTPTGGTPQGAIISPLLANIYLHPLDAQMTRHGYRMVRYADDFVTLCQSAETAQATMSEVHQWVEANGLTLHPEKTHEGDCRHKDQGFDFLGYRFEAGNRWVRKKSLKALKHKVRSKTRRTRGTRLSRVIEDLNPMLRGWYGCFKHAHPWIFRRFDQFIRRRLRALMRKQTKRPGMGR